MQHNYNQTPTRGGGGGGGGEQDRYDYNSYYDSTPSSGGSRRDSKRLSQASIGIMQGNVGSGFGRFPSEAAFAGNHNHGSFRDSMAARQSVHGLDFTIGETEVLNSNGRPQSTLTYSTSGPDFSRGQTPFLPEEGSGKKPGELLWEEKNVEDDDWLHDPEADAPPKLAASLQNVGKGARAHYNQPNVINSKRGWFNSISLAVLVLGLLLLFLFSPVYVAFIKPLQDKTDGFNLGGINGSGQMPQIEGFSGLVDTHTPDDAKTRKGFDGHDYNLVFSDEFEVDGRTFWPGDDPYWEAVDLNYWATVDIEWYDPDAITTRGGNLVVTQSQQSLHNLNFRSGMLQSWNKLCFTGGYIEVNLSLPGDASHPGFWVGVWTIGNLVRAGYGATAEGVWPYSYDACDVGTYPGQVRPDGTPAAAKTSGEDGGSLSALPGQKLSACTCKGEDHPGPSHDVGRGGPEIDIIEAQTYFNNSPRGAASQSIQIGPMDAGYEWQNGSDALIIYNETNTIVNKWHGAQTQESLSINSGYYNQPYGGEDWATFGFEYEPGKSGHITWGMEGEPTVQLTSKALGPNAEAEIDQRTIAEEPMSVVINLALSTKFGGTIDWGRLHWPVDLLVDYVRIYQRADQDPQVSCDPKDHPTADYINKHPEAYQNPNATIWNNTGYSWPKNKGFGGC